MEPEADLITGQPQPTDNDDEYVRQAVERKLLDLGYSPGQVRVDYERTLSGVLDEPLTVRADLLVFVGEVPAMLIRCARGSLVTREKEVVAAARLISDPWPPFGVTANGQEAQLLDTATGEVLDQGAEAIPSPDKLAALMARTTPHHPDAKELLKAARICHACAFIQCPSKCTV